MHMDRQAIFDMRIEANMQVCDLRLDFLHVHVGLGKIWTWVYFLWFRLLNFKKIALVNFTILHCKTKFNLVAKQWSYFYATSWLSWIYNPKVGTPGTLFN